MAKKNASNLGIPESLTTPDMFMIYLIDTCHEWLVDNNLVLDNFVYQILDCIKIITSSTGPKFNTPNFQRSGDLMTTVEPIIDDIMLAGFDPCFIDGEWTAIKKSVEMNDWMKEIAIGLPYLQSVSEPNCNMVEKRKKIKLVVSMVMSALYNNGCDFGDLGGKKPETQMGDKVPPINNEVYLGLYNQIQKKLRYKRSNRKRDVLRKNESADDSKADNTGNDVEDDEEDEGLHEEDFDSPVYTPVGVAVSSISRGNKGKTPISSAKSTISGSNKNSKQIAGKKRQNAEEEETRKAQRLLDEEAERQDAEMQAKKDNSVVIRMPNGPLMRMNKNKAAELSQEKGKDLIKLAKKTNKAKTSPTKSPRKPKSAKKNN